MWGMRNCNHEFFFSRAADVRGKEGEDGFLLHQDVEFIDSVGDGGGGGEGGVGADMVDFLVGFGGFLELGDEVLELELAGGEGLFGGGGLEAEAADADPAGDGAQQGEEEGEDGEGVGGVCVARDAVQVDAEQPHDHRQHQPAAADHTEVVRHAHAPLLQLLPHVALHHVLHCEQPVPHRVLLLQHLPRLLVHLLQNRQRVVPLEMRHELMNYLLSRMQRPLYPNHLASKTIRDQKKFRLIVDI
jgi:hypothetical protein